MTSTMDHAFASSDSSWSNSDGATPPGSSVEDANIYDLAPATADNASLNSSLSTTPPTTLSSACLGCREKHLKCDGQYPCGRCSSNQRNCMYVASMRGFRGRKPVMQAPLHQMSANGLHRLSEQGRLAAHDIVHAADTSAMMLSHPATGNQPNEYMPSYTPANYQQQPIDGLTQAALYTSRETTSATGLTTPSAMPRSALQPKRSISVRALDAFYSKFFAAHPFVLPRDRLLHYAQTRGDHLEHVLAAMRYIGCAYLDEAAKRSQLLTKALQLIITPTTIQDGFLVQAMLLLIIGLDGDFQHEQARDLLRDCERLALQIGLNTTQFAVMGGSYDPVLQESWRRTWWDLYCVDGMVAGAHMTTNFALFDVDAGAALPCEEADYLRGTIPTLMSLDDLEDDVFSEEHQSFSSFAYRVLAMRNFGKMMRAQATMTLGAVDRLQRNFTNWELHLPSKKRSCLDHGCNYDEMMFQAHFMTKCCTIMLHQPLSQLDTEPARSVIACKPHRPVISGGEFNRHTYQVITAAASISKMMTLPAPMISHTPFFTCVITNTTIALLARWASPLFTPEDDHDLAEQIKLSIGSLRELSQVWINAKHAMDQVKNVAREIHRTKKTAQMDATHWTQYTSTQMMSQIQQDEAIIANVMAASTLPMQAASLQGMPIMADDTYMTHVRMSASPPMSKRIRCAPN